MQELQGRGRSRGRGRSVSARTTVPDIRQLHLASHPRGPPHLTSSAILNALRRGLMPCVYRRCRRPSSAALYLVVYSTKGRAWPASEAPTTPVCARKGLAQSMQFPGKQHQHRKLARTSRHRLMPRGT